MAAGASSGRLTGVRDEQDRAITLSAGGRKMKRATLARIAVLGGMAGIAWCALSLGSALSAGWGSPVRVESIPGTSPDFNYSGLDGCPFESPDGLSFYMATDRPGGQGGIDIWRSTRSSTNAPWGAPVNPGAPVNSSADDFCPTPVSDGRLFFVSARPGGCGGPDLYVSSPAASGGWAEPKNLGCQANSPAPEFSPSLVDMGGGDVVLFFSSARPGGFAAEAEGAVPDHDIYYSRALPDGSFGHAILVEGVNSGVDDARPNVRLDGLEMVFDSPRPGGQGATDIWVSSRASVKAAWSTPANPGAPINSAAGESRASLSRTGERLYFGSARPGGDGGSDVYVATRGGSIAGSTTSAGVIAPPNTGDGGLADQKRETSASLVVLLVLLVALPAVSRRLQR
jgi:hypothetical protein